MHDQHAGVYPRGLGYVEVCLEGARLAFDIGLAIFGVEFMACRATNLTSQQTSDKDTDNNPHSFSSQSPRNAFLGPREGFPAVSELYRGPYNILSYSHQSQVIVVVASWCHASHPPPPGKAPGSCYYALETILSGQYSTIEGAVAAISEGRIVIVV